MPFSYGKTCSPVKQLFFSIFSIKSSKKLDINGNPGFTETVLLTFEKVLKSIDKLDGCKFSRLNGSLPALGGTKRMR